MRCVKVWDLHDLVGVVVGGGLVGGEEGDGVGGREGGWGGGGGGGGGGYELRRIKRGEAVGLWQLEGVKEALEGIGVGFARFCGRGKGGEEGGGETSMFAMVGLDEEEESKEENKV